MPGIDLDGVPVPAEVLTPTNEPDQEGLLRTVSDGAKQVDPGIDHTGENALPSGTQWTWTGTLTAPVTGEYELKLQTAGGSGSLSIDGVHALATGGFFNDASLIPTADGLSNATVTLSLVAGEPREIQVTMGAGGPGFLGGPSDQPLQARLAWVTPERRQVLLSEAVDAAREAHAAVVFAYVEGTEGRDRPSLSLPDPQSDLVAGVVGANSRSSVVLNTSDPILMPWLYEAGAVLQMWFPGQEGAEATAALLLGHASPGGKLPVTFPRSEEATPVAGSSGRYPGVDGRADYGEDILVGYRWYDGEGVEPLFPFGHGLSYTTFEYSALRATPGSEGFDISFRVRNTGDVAGSEVAQVYLTPPEDPPVSMAPRHLVGFQRIDLWPGEEREVTMHIDRRGLSYWSADRHDWIEATGERFVDIGSSSRDIRLRGEITVTVVEP